MTVPRQLIAAPSTAYAQPSAQLNCDELRGCSAAERAQVAAAAAAVCQLRPLGSKAGAASLWEWHTAGADLQPEIDAEVAAAGRDAGLAQCQALLALEDPDCLPHDPLFGLLPPRALGTAAAAAAAAQQRTVRGPADLALALAAAAKQIAALRLAGSEPSAVVADSCMEATTQLPPAVVPGSSMQAAATQLTAATPGTCCRKRGVADGPAPATQPCNPLQRRTQQLLQRGGGSSPSKGIAAVVPPGTTTVATAAAAASTGGNMPAATPLQPCSPEGLAAAKCQRLLLLTNGTGTAAGGAGPMNGAGGGSVGSMQSGKTPGSMQSGGTPGSGVGSSGKVPAQCRAVRRVARDLSFTPAPPEPVPSGTPQTAGSAAREDAVWSPLPATDGTRAVAGGRQRCVVRPFSLLRSPNTRACIDKLNQSVQASAAAAQPARFERCAAGTNSSGSGPCGNVTPYGQLPSAGRFVRLC